MAIQPKSSNLFHFARKLEYIKSILISGFIPRYNLEDTRHIGIDFTAMPMTCFCDIPISRIFDHTAFYGDYGIGMTKDWGSKNKLTPLLYTHDDGPIPSFLNYVIKQEDSDADAESVRSSLNEDVTSILPYVKPLSGNMIVNGDTVRKDFYQENEWRYVPKHFEIEFFEKFKERQEELNKSVESRKLEFLPTDIKYIFVKDDGEIPDIFDFIQNKLGHWPLNEIKILSTRITSLETLSKDL